VQETHFRATEHRLPYGSNGVNCYTTQVNVP